MFIYYIIRLIGTTIQYFHEKILALLVDKDERVRSAAVNTTHSIVSHRLVIPIEVLIALSIHLKKLLTNL